METPASPQRSQKQSGVSLLVFVVTILFVAIGAYLLGVTNKPSVQQRNLQVSVPTATPLPTIISCDQKLFEAHAAKYPEPTSQPIPPGLEDELFAAYITDKYIMWRHENNMPIRTNFHILEYYGDVSKGRLDSGVQGEGTGWTMNNVNGKWKVIIDGQLEASPHCQILAPFYNDLKEWQGICHGDNDSNNIVDIIHPDEPYNRCEF